MNNPMNSSQFEFARLFYSACVRIPAIAGIIILISVSGFQVLAGDVWKDKDYEDWTSDDVYTILYESPWVKSVAKDASWIEGNASYLAAIPTDCDGRPDFSRKRETPPQLAMGLTMTLVEYRVIWMSSRTIRSAKMRESILCGKLREETAEDFLEQEVDRYQIDVKAPDMKPFEDMDDEAIRQNTWLTFKKAKKKINPNSLRVRRMSGERRIYSISFMFDKESEDGEAYVSPDEKEIEFTLESGKFEVKVRFKLKKMVTKEGVDL